MISELNIAPFVQTLSDSKSSLLVPTFPMWGNVKLIICPAYDGSEIISWYPVKEVLKQIYPVAVPWYPSPIPLKTCLLSRTKIPVGNWCLIAIFFFCFLFNYNSWVKGLYNKTFFCATDVMYIL